MRYVLALILMVGCAKATPTNTNALCQNLPNTSTVTCTQESGFVDVSACGADFHLVNNITYVCGGCTAPSQTDNSQYVQAATGSYEFPQGGAKGVDCTFTVTNGALTANFN